MRERLTQVRVWPTRRWLAAGVGTVLAGAATGIPTGIVRTDLYTRMTPVRWWDYPFWAVSAALIGLLLATYVPTPASRGVAIAATGGRTIGASILSVFAIGCPVCNKLVVALLGFSGALTYFAPIQPALGVLSIAVLAASLNLRLRGELSCRLVGS